MFLSSSPNSPSVRLNQFFESTHVELPCHGINIESGNFSANNSHQATSISLQFSVVKQPNWMPNSTLVSSFSLWRWPTRKCVSGFYLPQVNSGQQSFLVNLPALCAVSTCVFRAEGPNALGIKVEQLSSILKFWIGLTKSISTSECYLINQDITFAKVAKNGSATFSP